MIKFKTTLILSLLCILFITSVLFLEFKMRFANQHYSKVADVIIILGAKVRDDGPSLSLLARMDAAILAAKHNPKANLVLSGGQGSDEPMSEGQAMYDYLTPYRVLISNA